MAGETEEQSNAQSWAVHSAAYGAFTLAVILLTFPTAWDMARTWISSSTYHHGLLAAPAAVWMIVKHSWRPEHETSQKSGWLITGAGSLTWLLGQAASAAIVSQLGLVTIFIGGAGVVFGERALALWAWPLAFLYFMVPAGESLLPALQQLTAGIAVGFLNLFGFKVEIDGVLIHTKVGAFAIAEACAGLRLLTAAVMVSAIFAYVAFNSWTKRFTFLAFAIVFSVAANALRAFLLILVPLLTGQQHGLGPDHFIIGWLLYLIVLIMLIIAGRQFADRHAQPRPQHTPPPVRPLGIAAAVIIVMAAAVWANLVVQSPPDRTAPSSFTLLNADGWRLLPPPENWRAQFPNADRTSHATYDREGERVYLSHGYFTHDRRNAEIAGAGNRAYDGENWRRIGGHDAVIYLFGKSAPYRFDRLAGPEHRKLLALTFYWLDDKIYETPQAVKMAQMKFKLAGRNPPGGVIVLSASYTEDPIEAVEILRQYTGDLENSANWRRRLGAG